MNSLKSMWFRFGASVTINERRTAIAELVKEAVKNPLETAEIDKILFECAARPVLFEHGMSVAMFASYEMREAFRKKLVECGAILQAMRLAALMERPLSRDEIVTLGNRHIPHVQFLTREEVTMFIAYAERTIGIRDLDLRRLRKQSALAA